MAIEEHGTVTYNNLTSTTHTFTYLQASYEVWSPDTDIYVQEDGDASIASFRVPQNTLHAPSIACKTLGILGIGGNGTVYIKGIPQHQGITDAEVFAARALIGYPPA